MTRMTLLFLSLASAALSHSADNGKRLSVSSPPLGASPDREDTLIGSLSCIGLSSPNKQSSGKPVIFRKLSLTPATKQSPPHLKAIAAQEPNTQEASPLRQVDRIQLFSDAAVKAGIPTIYHTEIANQIKTSINALPDNEFIALMKEVTNAGSHTKKWGELPLTSSVLLPYFEYVQRQKQLCKKLGVEFSLHALN